jgi:outer membrane protein OmpA-like peptidoglycan-associated protein
MNKGHKDELNYWPSFADIFASLFFIFLILFSVYYTSMRKIADAAQEDIDDLKTMMKALDIEKLDDDGKLVIPGDLLFDSGKSYIRVGRAEDFATKVAVQLSKYFKTMERQKKYTIIVEGHTDTVDSEEYNNNLSLNRALSLISHIEQHLDPAVQGKIEFIPAGYGETMLLIPTADNKNEQRNRRVVIRIMPKFNMTIESMTRE